jgi:hypothetical protein
MVRQRQKSGSTCSEGCSHCSELRESLERVSQGPSGWRLSVSAAATFLLPLLAALAGAVAGSSLDGEGRSGQFVGASTGLAAGLLAGPLLARRLVTQAKESE